MFPLFDSRRTKRTGKPIAPAQVLGPGDYLKPKSRTVRNEATALRNRQEFQRSQLTELASTDFESWAKESYEIATKFAYRNGRLIGSPRGENTDCAMVAAVPVLPVGYIVSGRRIADRRMILAGYRRADLLMRVASKL